MSFQSPKGLRQANDVNINCPKFVLNDPTWALT